jgi:CRP-like cAMP-binding protein
MSTLTTQDALAHRVGVGAGLTGPHAYQLPWEQGRSSPQAEWLSSHQLLQWLDGSLTAIYGAADCANGTIMAVRLFLSPGDVLYAQGSPSAYVYMLESGLVQCRSHSQGLDGPDAASYVGASEWTGLFNEHGLHLESVEAVAHSSLLALPIGELVALSASSPPIAELLSRCQGLALARDGRLASSLRDLSPYTRTVVGLIHLVHMIDPQLEAGQHESRIWVALNVSMLAHWLGLGLSQVHQYLWQLQRVGALRCNEARIMDVFPQGLFSVSCAIRE